MKFLLNLSIRSKITVIIAIVSIIAIIIGFSILTINSISNLKKNLVAQNALTARLLSEYIIFPLIFDENEEAVEQINKLEVIEFVEKVELYDAKGNFFASYHNLPATNKKFVQKTSTHYFENDKLYIIEPVMSKGEFLGTLLFVISTENLRQKVKEYILLLIVTGIIVAFFVVLLANSFQKIISLPILKLATSIQKISETGDFSIRVQKWYNDEIGFLYDGFNNMLEQIVKRDIETHRAQAALAESQEQFSTFMELLPAAAYIKNPDSTFRFVNRFLVENFDADKWIGKKIIASYMSDEKDLLEKDAQALKENIHYEQISYDNKNQLRQFEIWKFPIHRKDKPTLIGGIGIDVTQRKEAERKVQYYIHQLEKNNQELEEFNYVASHDLREPLRTITSYCDLLSEDLGENISSDVQEDINFIVDAATRMNTLIQDLLQLSRAGRVEYSKEPVDLNFLIQTIVSDLELKIKETNAKIIWSNIPIIKGDAVQLRRVFQNLITNAIKFRSDNKPIVKIEAEKKDKKIIIKVIDNGIGIKKEYQEQIFLPFKRLHSRNKYEGTGIGLAICKKIIDRHKASISIESEEGKGTTFTIVFNDDLNKNELIK
ncbi:MAG: ATP-binding protein [Bacteroidales bacterium]|nr:ATP-binding protein [Bacteroidales bacterium]